MYNFSQRILVRVFVRNIVNIRNECLFSWFKGNESECQTNKSHKLRSGSRVICLSCGQIHSP